MKTWPIIVLGIALGLAPAPPWIPQESGTKARFRGLSVASKDVAWASGSQGTCVTTADGGATWKKATVPDAATLDFRDVQGFDARTATLLSIGPGELSRIYRTTDGGETWTLQHTNRDPKGFLDAIAFWDLDHGLALGDPVDGRYVILTTADGGKTWTQIPDAGMPEALPGEGAFAASGTCLVVQGDSNAWFGTGGGASARVFRSTDRGKTWSVARTPIRAGIASAGVFSLAFRDPDHGIAVGGDYKRPDDPAANLATTSDGGRTWTPGGRASSGRIPVGRSLVPRPASADPGGRRAVGVRLFGRRRPDLDRSRPSRVPRPGLRRVGQGRVGCRGRGAHRPFLPAGCFESGRGLRLRWGRRRIIESPSQCRTRCHAKALDR